jgi:lipooligosaccharide transport system permease protein
MSNAVRMAGALELLSGAWRIASRNVLVWRHYAGASALGNFGEPVLYLVALGFGLGRVVPDLGGMTYAEFIAPGLVVSTVMYTATFECTFGSYTRLETERTYDAILATPITPSELVAGEVLWGGIKSVIGASFVLSVIALFGLTPSWTAVFVLPVAFVAGLLFSSMALTVTAFSKSYEFFSYYFTLLVAPMFLFSGIFFPLERMPEWVGISAQLLPLTHVVELARALVRGDVGPGLVVRLLACLAFLTPAYLFCQKLIRRRLDR